MKSEMRDSFYHEAPFDLPLLSLGALFQRVPDALPALGRHIDGGGGMLSFPRHFQAQPRRSPREALSSCWGEEPEVTGCKYLRRRSARWLSMDQEAAAALGSLKGAKIVACCGLATGPEDWCGPAEARRHRI
ncbi:hypothetical protein NDU88_010836 [Pleurodeles waltl]|uniref:Uncharacterized protein n=1 Tax=Pleurodeles waltl TaxID=8319 RepID=A0AAV7PZJ6_PLEWA|nr:hypothetical protein NDU88_010836 [Pleurodeles waltl]